MAIRWVNRTVLGASLVLALTLTGCHADDNDPKGQASELEDPVRREHAMGRLQAIFNERLAEAKGDRAAASVKEFADQTIEPMVQIYLNHPEDNNTRLRVIGLLQELRDPRSLPALKEALNWQKEINEDQAMVAARTLRQIEIPEGERSAVVSELARALDRVDGGRPVDNRMRQAFIETLGELGGKEAIPALTKAALSQSPEQNFLFNILAGQQLVNIGDPSSVPTFVQALFITDPKNPAMRMNDVAASGLVAIGKPSLAPLVQTLKGENEEANGLAKAYIEAVRKQNEEAAAAMKAQNLVSSEAAYTLGKLGMPEAIPALIEESKSEDTERAISAALALVSISREPAQTQEIVDALVAAYERATDQQRPQLLVAIRHLYADEAMPFLEKIATKANKDLAAIQMYGFLSYAMLADKQESQSILPVFNRKSAIQEYIKDYGPVLEAARVCDRDISCWIGKLGDSDKLVVRKATNMLARLGRGNEEAMTKLIDLFGHSDLEVRNEALFAADYMAVNGSKKAVEKIDQLEASEGGRSIWNNFKREALPTRARLQARASS